MKILVVGCGSIGARHAANVAAAGEALSVCDRDFDRAQAVAAQTGGAAFSDLDAALAGRPDGVIVATPHHAHIAVARAAVASGAAVLIEKPLSHGTEGVDEFLSFAAQAGRAVFVACNMRYHPAVDILRRHLPAVGAVRFARAQYGNWLPGMRPDADYTKLYCAHKDQGGGVILDAIHEIDYLSWLLGGVESVLCDADRRSDLTIDVEDYAAIILRHRDGARSEIHLDYLQRAKRRGCDIVGADGTLSWISEGKNPESCTVRLYEAGTGAWTTLLADDALDALPMYRAMLDDFLSVLAGGPAAGMVDGITEETRLLDGRAALDVLRVALAARVSAETGRKVECGHDDSE